MAWFGGWGGVTQGTRLSVIRTQKPGAAYQAIFSSNAPLCTQKNLLLQKELQPAARISQGYKPPKYPAKTV